MKKIWNRNCICLVFVLCLAACSPSSTGSDSSTEGSPGQTIEAVNSFYIYCNDAITGELLESFLTEKPEYRERVHIVGMEEENYPVLLENKLNDPNGEEYPDLAVMSQNMKDTYVERDVLAPVSSFGITENDLSHMYDYMLQYGMDSSGTLKALSWMDTASVFVYRTSLAKEYLEITAPDAMEDAMNSWAAFADTAALLCTQSEGKVRILPELDTVKKMLYYGNPNSWYPEGSADFVISDFLIDGLMGYKELTEDLTWDKKIGTDDWYQAMSDGSTLGFFGNSYFVEQILAGQCGSTAGDWAVCLGPSSYELDGIWLSGTSQCSDPDLAGEILRYVTGKRSVLKKIAENHHIAVNHSSLMNTLSSSDQSHGDVLASGGMFTYASVSGSFLSQEDRTLNDLFWRDAEYYWDDTLDIEEVLERFVEDAEKNAGND